MAARKNNERRRVPRQERSKATTDAIIEAAARVFAVVGVEKSTTNQIAEVAGVSVGSLYQYFPNKQSLIEALYDRESERLHEVFLEMIADLGTRDVPRLIRAFVSETLKVFENNASLYRVLFEEVPRTAGLELNHRIDDRAIAALQPLLLLGFNRIQPRDPAIAAQLLARTYRYNTVVLLRNPPTAEKREAYIDELTAMLSQYLLAPRT